MAIVFMYALLMILVALFGFSLSQQNMICTLVSCIFKAMLRNFLKGKIKSLQSDWGGEFHALNPILACQGISHRVSCPHTHQQQGFVERKHIHLIETGLSFLAVG